MINTQRPAGNQQSAVFLLPSPAYAGEGTFCCWGACSLFVVEIYFTVTFTVLYRPFWA